MKTMTNIIVNFREAEDSPVIKDKFCVYTCTYVGFDRILNGLEQAKKLNVGGFRYDLGWGFGSDDKTNSPREIEAPQIENTDPPVIHTEKIDIIMDQLSETKIPGMLVYAYNPICLQDTLGNTGNMNENLSMRSNWNTVPSDPAKWAEVCRLLTNHVIQKGCMVRFVEIWNEPDLQPVFFTGTKKDYLHIYDFASRAVRSASENIRIGGPAMANDLSWVRVLIEQYMADRFPLDYLSMHCYGDPKEICNKFFSVGEQYFSLNNKEWIISEYNPFTPGTPDFTTGGAIEQDECSIRLLDAFDYYLSVPDINQVYWAQLQDPEVWGAGVDRCGLLDLNDAPKPAFYAWQMFAQLPSSRMICNVSQQQIGCIASANRTRAAILIWNRTSETQTYHVFAEGITSKMSRLTKVMMITSGESHQIINETITESSNILDGSIKPYGVLLYLWQAYNDKDLCRRNIPVQIMRWHNRKTSTCYADYDSIEQQVFLGAGDDPKGTAAWIGLDFQEAFSIEGMSCSLRLCSMNGEEAVYLYDGKNTDCYTKKMNCISAPPWEREWGTFNVYPFDQLINANFKRCKTVLFRFKPACPGEKIIWKLNDSCEQ